MADLSGLRRLSQFFGTILSGASAGLTTHDLWSAVQSAATSQYGRALSGVTIQDMNVLRGLAGAQLNASRNFMNAAPEQGITAQMWANELDQRSYAERQAAPQWVVRFEHTFLTPEGEPETSWRSSVWDQLPVTKAALLDALAEDAEGLADDYGTTNVGVGAVMITSR